MSSFNSPTKIQNPKSNNLLETAELLFLFASALGLAGALFFQQAIYAEVPIIIALLLNFVNRQKLQRQIKTSTAAALDRTNQQAAATDRSIEQLQIAIKSLDEVVAQTSRESINPGPGENVHSLISALENLRQRVIILEKTIKMIQSEIEITSRQFKQRPELEQIENLTTIMLDLQQFINELPQWGNLQQRQLTELHQQVDNALQQVSQAIDGIPHRVQEAVQGIGGEFNQQLSGNEIAGDGDLERENSTVNDRGNRHKHQNEKIRQKYPRAYIKWSREEDENLIKEYADGQDINEIAKKFQRQPVAIRSRLQKLGLAE
ncbi:MAG: hypothetical protein MUE44_27040 [Oscillatoriaceae cyanobacterium Prado104]|jgi:archaellum component FlaC|nr:hypothetical protein [Oscillatoriaceae cyanobacterium Prado104]